jgi:hypothetical protein
MTVDTLTSMRELDSRVNDGIHVRMLWSQQEDRVVVAVNDDRTGKKFAVEVPKGEAPLRVFHHPFAYA